MKNHKRIYWATTGLLTVMMLMSAGMYIFNHAEISKAFTTFGYPTYVIYPLAAAKILGLITIWLEPSTTLKEWAYAGFFFNFVLAFFAHYMISDGESPGALGAIVLLFVSYFFWKKTTNLS